MDADAPLSYRDAGVDIDAGNRLVDLIKPAVARTHRRGVLGGLGGFGGLFQLDTARYADPVLVAGTDGVGTKLLVAQRMGRHDTIGIDLVAMSANDVLVQGAEPLFFLDYFACGKLDTAVAAKVVEGVAKGCELAGCALLGGETAEMPDLYDDGEYDLAGFCVGAADRATLIDGSKLTPGDQLIGVASSGLHSNGYSLVRRVLDKSRASLDQTLGDTSLGDALIAPTAMYCRAILDVLDACEVHALAHVTGGGLAENALRVVPESLGLGIDFAAWPRPEVFDWIADQGPIDEAEMRRVFNLGVGFVVMAPAGECDRIGNCLDRAGLGHWVIGDVRPATDGRPRIIT